MTQDESKSDETDLSPYNKSRKDKGEVVGGGFVILRRGKSSNRIKLNRSDNDGKVKIIDPFEHGNLEGAIEQAKHLAKRYPQSRFSVFQQVFTVEEES